jgi:hypothetical protein
VPRRRLRLAESRPAGTRYPPRSGRVGSASCTGGTFAGRRSVPPACLGGGFSPVGHSPVSSSCRAGDGLAVSTHCQQGELVAYRARVGRPGLFAQPAWCWPGAPTSFPGDKSSKTWKSRQEGLHLLAQGAFPGIRNVAARTVGEWSEQVALEHLAVLSVVARWADETEVVTAP